MTSTRNPKLVCDQSCVASKQHSAAPEDMFSETLFYHFFPPHSVSHSLQIRFNFTPSTRPDRCCCQVAELERVVQSTVELCFCFSYYFFFSSVEAVVRSSIFHFDLVSTTRSACVVWCVVTEQVCFDIFLLQRPLLPLLLLQAGTLLKMCGVWLAEITLTQTAGQKHTADCGISFRRYLQIFKVFNCQNIKIFLYH